ncbi:MAG: NYN domain-containing protein [Pirellulales bacterium]|nr:NYN domain-containing protein [Pirellulales bacterium]
MKLIIDGYNLLHASGVLGQGRGLDYLRKSRQALLNCLAESLPPTELPQTTVVFDATDPPWNAPKQQKHAGMTVVFASHFADADSYIEELIKQNSAPRRLTVVSSDHRLHRAAKRRKATPIDSDLWFRELLRQRQSRRSPSGANPGDDQVVKPEGPFSEGETQYWLKQFGIEEGK